MDVKVRLRAKISSERGRAFDIRFWLQKPSRDGCTCVRMSSEPCVFLALRLSPISNFGLILVFSRVAQPRCRMPRENVVIRPVRAENGLFSPGTDLRLGKAIYSSFCQGDSAPLGCGTLSNCKNAIRSRTSDPKTSSMSCDDFLHCFIEFIISTILRA
jgi:hypothetical protein